MPKNKKKEEKEEKEEKSLHTLTLVYYSGRREILKCNTYELTDTTLITYSDHKLPGSKTVRARTIKDLRPLGPLKSIKDTYNPRDLE